MWLKKCEQINNTGVVDTSEAKKTEGRHKAVAYLCNSSNWDSYVAKTTGENPTNVISGSYAVGGPTLELFVKAWNNRAANVTTTSINENNVTVDGYPETISFGISNDILKLSTGNKEGLFNPTGNSSYWLACPYEESGKTIVIRLVNCGGYNVTYSGYGNSNGVRPLVSIPMSNVTITGTTGNYKVDIGFGTD